MTKIATSVFGTTTTIDTQLIKDLVDCGVDGKGRPVVRICPVGDAPAFCIFGTVETVTNPHPDITIDL